VHRNVKLKILLFALLIVTVCMVIVPQQQYLLAGSNGNQTQTESEADSLAGQDSENQGSADGETAGQSDSLDDDLVSNQSDSSSGDTSDLPSNNISQEAITTSPSDIMPGNQTSNQTEETTKPRMFERQLSPDVLKDFSILTPSPPYKIKATFDSMTVHNDHEGALSGDGEYDIAAYVQGIKVGLTDASGPGDGLWDVSSGETVTFDPGTEVIVDIPPTVPLSIFTVGSEVDGCDRTAFPENVQSTIVDIIQNSPVGGIIAAVDAIRGVDEVQKHINGAINWIGCKLNPNDVLGTINQAYEPTSYGAGSHTEKSNNGDFTLRYTISVTTPPAPQNQQPDLGTKFESQLNKNLSILEPDTVK
jgi:hypothetical protein